MFNLEYVSSGHTIYVTKDVRIRGYFSKPLGVREQRKFGKHWYKVWLLAHAQLIVNKNKLILCFCFCIIQRCGSGSSVGIATELRAWRFGDRIPVGTRFSARPDRPWGPPRLLYNGYRVFPGGKVRPGRAADHSRPSSAAVLEE